MTEELTDEQVEALEKELAQLETDEAARDAEAKRARRAVEAKAKLEAARKYGRKNIDFYYSSLGLIILKKPSLQVYTAYQQMLDEPEEGKTKFDVSYDFVVAQTCFPDATGIKELLREQAAIIDQLLLRVATLAGFRKKEITAK